MIDERMPGPPPEVEEQPPEAAGDTGAPDSFGTDSPAEGEAAAEPEPRAQRREQSYNKAFAALERKRKAHQAERSAYEQERQQYKQEREQFQRQVQALQQARQMAPDNPEEWLKQGGLDKNRIDAYYKQRQGEPAYDARFEKITALERALAERDARLERLEQTQNAHAERVYMDGIEREIRTAGEEFELINHLGRHSDVAIYQAKYYEKHKEWLPTKKAAADIENLLVEQQEADIRKGLASQKLAKRLGWQPNQNQPGTEAAAAEAKAPDKPSSNRKLVATERKRPPLEPTLSNEQRWEKLMERVR